ncbi:MAG: DUF3566 domain-containing protein [Candidatus Zixiibacteriota bacterium]
MDDARTTDSSGRATGDLRHEIRRIGMLSTIKTLFVVGGACGFAIGLLQWFFLQSLLSYSYSSTMQSELTGMPGMPDLVGMAGSVAWILPLIGGAGGAATGIVIGVIVALVYNVAARIWGGIEIELRPCDAVAKPIAIPVARSGETTPLPTMNAPAAKAPPPREEPPNPTPPASHFFE